MLQQQIAVLEAATQERVSLRPEYRLLRTVPGIGEMLATTIMLETGPMSALPQSATSPPMPLCRSCASSNGKKKGEGNSRNGNKYLAWAFVEAANFALRYCQQAKRFYERKKRKTNTAVATKALAHKLARACYHIMKGAASRSM